jgi:hypothetical protein
VSLVLLGLAVVNYSFCFDVLAPGFPNGGSIRAYMGPWFIGPIVLLTAIQALFSSGLLHITTRAFYPDRRDFLKALFTTSLLTALFSVYYDLVPSWGPYTFLTGAFRGVPGTTYVILGLWTAFSVLTTALVIWRIYRFRSGEIRKDALILLSGCLFILVMAFAEG